MSQSLKEQPLAGELPTPENWSEFAVFRESFLSVHLNEKNADALRLVGRMLYDKVVFSTDSEREEEDDETVIAELRGAVLDLRQMEGFLVSLGKSMEAWTLGPRGAAICLRATASSVEVARLAEGLEEILRAGPEPDLPPETPGGDRGSRPLRWESDAG